MRSRLVTAILVPVLSGAALSAAADYGTIPAGNRAGPVEIRDGISLASTDHLAGGFGQVAADGGRMVAAMGDGLAVVVLDGGHRRLAGRLPLPGIVTSLAVRGGIAHVGVGDAGPFVVDVADPARPVVIGRDPPEERLHEIAWFPALRLGEGLLVATSSGGRGVYSTFSYFDVFDTRSVGRPVHVAHRLLATFGQPDALAVSGDVAYVAEPGAAVWVVDLSDPSRTEIVHRLAEGASVVALAAGGSWLYVLASTGVDSPTEPPGDATAYRLVVFDLADPRRPREIGKLAMPSHPRKMALAPPRLYVSSEDPGALDVYDVSDPARPARLGRTSLAGATDERVRDIAAVGHHVIHTLGAAGLLVLDASRPAAIVESGRLDPAALTRPTDVVGNGRWLYVASADGLAVLDRGNGAGLRQAAVVEDLVDPLRLVLDGDLLYVLGASHLYALDASDPGAPVLAGGVALEDAGWLRDLVVLGTHLYVAESRAYRDGRLQGRDGIRVFSLRDAARPEEIGRVDDGTPYAAVDAVGDRLVGATPARQVRTFDLTEPSRPVLASEHVVPDGLPGAYLAVTDVLCAPTRTFVLSGGCASSPFDVDRGVVDVLDPASPADVAARIDVDGPGRLALAAGGLVLASNACGRHGGLTVIDPSDPAGARRAAVFAAGSGAALATDGEHVLRAGQPSASWPGGDVYLYRLTRLTARAHLPLASRAGRAAPPAR